MTAGNKSVSQTACAKINLTLHVTARRKDGYHELDSLVAFAGVGDELILTPAAETSLEISGPFAAQLRGETANIATRAADAMRAAWPDKYRPVAIELTKNLPVASGIGGGSADAAAVLRGLQQLFGQAGDQARLGQIALGLGADVPVCLLSRACRMSGIGQQLHVLQTNPSFAAILVNPGIAVSTPEIFAQLGLKPGAAAGSSMSAPPMDGSPQDWASWLTTCRNDLEAPAISLVPEIRTVLDAIGEAPGCLLARMSGSGATCFGLFQHQAAAQKAAKKLAASNPDWWVCQTGIK